MGVEEVLIICITVLAIVVIVSLIARRAAVQLAEVEADKKIRTYALNNQFKLDRDRIELQAYRGIPEEESDDMMSQLKQWLPLIMPYLTPEGQKAATALAGGMTDTASFLAALGAHPTGDKASSAPEEVTE